jgi:hypothetical protein
MSELGPSARSLLDAARGAGPDAAAIARMRSKIDLAITGGAAGAAAKLGTTTSSTKAIAAGSTITAGKLGLLAVVIAAGAGLLIAQRGSTSSDPLPASAPSESPAASLHTARELGPDGIAPTAPIPRATQASPPPQRAAVAPSPASPAPQHATAPVAAAPQPIALARPGSERVTLAREVELVDRAMLALKSGDAAAALVAARLHARETFARGQLAEDATAIEIEALCTLRQPAAHQLAAFDARWPASAQRARLTKVCR